MSWLIAVGIGGIAYAILETLKSKAQTEYECWDRAYLQTQERLRRHRDEITDHIESTQRCFDFRALTECHFVSVQLANEAYQRLRDARAVKKATHEAADAIKAKMKDIYRQAKVPGLSWLDRDKLHAQLDELKTVKISLFRDLDRISEQVKHFLAEVHQLNRKTHDLKCTIRDRCGWCGADWYNRLEARTHARRACRFV